MQHALSVAPFGELVDPKAMVDLAVAAEAAGWDGLYLWDHVHRDPAEVAEISDVWVTLAAVATATESIRIGPMVTPLSRRRMSTLIRQTVTLDHLSNGRLTLGIGLGVDTDGELTRFGEVTDLAPGPTSWTSRPTCWSRPGPERSSPTGANTD